MDNHQICFTDPNVDLILTRCIDFYKGHDFTRRYIYPQFSRFINSDVTSI